MIAGDPDGYRSFRGYPDDRAACMAATCEICGHVGLDYRALTKIGRPDGAGYYAVATCPSCGHAEEF